jgi:membrane-associated protease RseP (regulator of RpoE activity)
MAVAFAVLLFVLAIAGHELGHALAMRECRIPIKSMGIGIPAGLVITVKSKFIQNIFGNNCEIHLSPILLGAYVEPTKEISLHNLTLKNEAYIFGAGPLANIFMALVIKTVSVALWPTQDMTTAALLGMLLTIPVLWYFRRVISLWVFPIVGVVFFFWTLWIFGNISYKEALENNGSIVFFGEMAAKSINMKLALKFGFLVNLCLAFTNILPIGILDGGAIWKAILKNLRHIYSSLFPIPESLFADWKRLVGYFS